MARRKTTANDVAIIAGLAAADVPTNRIATETGMARSTVRDILEKIGPEVDQMRQLKRDELLTSWQDAHFRAYREMREMDEKGELKSGDRRNLAITMGIATEKASALAGVPTAIVANLHEVRVSLPDLLTKLTNVARVIEGGVAQITYPPRLPQSVRQ